jgi:hypothetical protein
VINWITGFVEKSNPMLNGWAPCPYARKARIDNKIEVRIGQHPRQDLVDIADHGLGELDVLVLIYDPEQYQLADFRRCWQQAQAENLDAKGLMVLEDHPQDIEDVGGVIMNQGTWALLFVQYRDRLEEAAQMLAKKGYYDGWPADYLEQLFHQRKDPRT